MTSKQILACISYALRRGVGFSPRGASALPCRTEVLRGLKSALQALEVGLGLLLIAGTATAQSGLRAPTVGLFREASGRLRTVSGIRANFVPGEIVAEDVHAIAAWGGEAILQTGAEIVVLQGGRVTERMPPPGGPCVLGMDRTGLPAVAVFPEARSMFLRRAKDRDERLDTDGEPQPPVRRGANSDVRGNGAGWTRTGLEIDGRLLAAAVLAPRSVTLLIHRPGGLWLRSIAPQTGAVLRELWVAAEAGAAAIVPGGGILYHSAGGLVLQTPGGEEQRLPLAESVASLEPVGAGWVQVRLTVSTRSLILRVGGDSLALYELPGGGS